ncbi:hypothetical protein HOG98_10260 [bacterium]|jgi:multicomponent Na+:H+ antiporter subunit D|nr:hypothetical protein [bacterium]
MIHILQSLINNIVVLPFFVALVTALVGIMWRLPGSGRRLFFSVSASIQVILACFIIFLTHKVKILFLPVGAWKAPFGISITIDIFGSLLIGITTLLSLFAILYLFATLKKSKENPLLLPLIQFMIAGIILSFSTGDFFNLFVSFEIFLIASYGLLTLKSDESSIKNAFPYLGINVIGGTLFVLGASFVYGMYGTLNFADISAQTSHLAQDPKLILIASYLVLVFGIKAGFFPLFYWLPRSYSCLPAPVAALFAGLLTKVGIYAIIRTLTTIFPLGLVSIYSAIGYLSIFTMVVAIIISLSRSNIREILCYNLISHIGFLMAAIAIFSPISLTGGIFYMMHHMVVIASLFLISGLVIQITKTDVLKDSGNVWKHHGFVGVLFLVQALSLAGLPPFSGFWGKFLILREAIRFDQVSVAAAIILASILTLLSMIRIWFHVFLKKNDGLKMGSVPKGFKRSTTVVSILVLFSLIMGIFSNPFISASNKAMSLLLNKSRYENKVLSYEQTLKMETDSHSSHSENDAHSKDVTKKDTNHHMESNHDTHKEVKHSSKHFKLESISKKEVSNGSSVH